MEKPSTSLLDVIGGLSTTSFVDTQRCNSQSVEAKHPEALFGYITPQRYIKHRSVMAHSVEVKHPEALFGYIKHRSVIAHAVEVKHRPAVS